MNYTQFDSMTTVTMRQERSWKLGFISGILAGTVSLSLMYALRISQLGIFTPELAVRKLVENIPGSVESFFISQMGEFAKYTAVIIAILIFLLIHGSYGLALPTMQRRFARRSTTIGVLTILPTAINLLVLFPVFGAGVLGAETSTGWAVASISTLVSSSVYAVLSQAVYLDFSRSYPGRFKLSRRAFIKTGAAVALGLAIVAYGLNKFVLEPARTGFKSIQELFTNEITPNDKFYIVTKNVIDPVVDGKTWSLMIDGHIQRTLRFSYEELLARPRVEEYITLECVSNEIGGDLISTAKWSGIPLQELLSEAGIEEDADYCVFSCEDGYTVGVPIQKALRPSSLLVLYMNDQTLPTNHGFPARIIVPGLYGMFDAKWVKQITLVKGEYNGFWQQKGWTNFGEVKTVAFIRVPQSGAATGPLMSIGGVAFAGDRGLSRVELSTDGGETWDTAELKTPLSRFTWVLWAYNWRPTQAGRYKIVVRAVDGSEILQEARVAPPFPNGASGYHSIDLTVSS